MSGSGRSVLPDAVIDLIAERFAVLAEPMRLKVLQRLCAAGEASVQELAESADATHANVSRHLNLLLRAGIVERRRHGTRAIYRISDPSVLRLCDEVCGGLAERHRELAAVLTPDPQQQEEAA